MPTVQADRIKRDVHATVLADYDVSHEVGRGAFGTVYKAVHKRTGHLVALKKCNKVLECHKEAHQMYREVCILRGVGEANHPYLVNLEHVMLVPGKTDVYLMFEFLSGDLRSAIRTGLFKSREEHLHVMYQMTSGMAHLQQRGILHRDLKPENVLIDTEASPHYTIQIADFGLARCESSLKHRDSSDDQKNSEGTLPYMSPEIALGIDKHTFASDMWALGIIFGELLAGAPFIRARDRTSLLKNVIAVIGPPSEEYMEHLNNSFLPACIQMETAMEHVDPDAGTPTELCKIFSHATDQDLDLLLRILNLQPLDRLSASAALQHACFSDDMALAYKASADILSKEWPVFQMQLDDEDEDDEIALDTVKVLLQEHVTNSYSDKKWDSTCACVVL